MLEYLKRHCGPDYFDACSEAGPLKIITKHHGSCRLLSLKEQISVSLNKHGSKVIALVGHHDCVSNPLPREAQEKQIEKALDYLQRAYGPDKLYLGLYVDEHWKVHEVMRFEAKEESP